MQRTKCAYCTFYRIGNVWTSICNCPDCEHENDECVEQIGSESEDCDCKVEG